MSSLVESANFSNHNDSLRVKWDERRRDGDGRWVTEHSGQDGCIKVGACVCGCVGG